MPSVCRATQNGHNADLLNRLLASWSSLYCGNDASHSEINDPRRHVIVYRAAPSVWKSDDRVTATDPASASPGRQIGIFAMSRVARRGGSADKTGNHLEGLDREARRPTPSSDRTPKSNSPKFGAGEGNTWHILGTNLAQSILSFCKPLILDKFSYGAGRGGRT